MDNKENTAVEMNAEEVMKKYDRESNTRTYTGVWRVIVTVILSVFPLYAVYTNIFVSLDTHITKALFVAWLLLLTFLLYPMRKGHKPGVISSVMDAVLAVLGCGAFLYYVINYRAIAHAAGRLTPLQIAIGVVGILVLLEACRRVSGIPILVVAVAFMAYSLIGGGLNLKTLVNTLFYTDNGIIGTPISVCSTYIVIFVLFGAFLETTGISDFFIRTANSLAGASSGGPAKVAVISSALCGMVSGSSVANTVTTGSVTIPMMKQTGYKPEFAGAVEAAASTGGQIMPPIMGAAAFLLAEFAGMPYAGVAVRAILPAILYFTGIFIMVHLEAKKLGLKGLTKENMPKFLPLILKEGYLLLPLVILTWLVVATNLMARSAFFAITAAIAVASFAKSRNVFFLAGKLVCCAAVTVMVILFGVTEPVTVFSALIVALALIVLAHFEKNEKIDFPAIVGALCSGAKSTLSVGVACAVAGIIAGVITKTGIGNVIISGIVDIAGEMRLIALALTMLCCIVLGMGVPTTANFIIMATTCAPILIQMGIPNICAYMFVFYFGIVADITPPVALAAYAGSAIAGSNPMKTGLNASKLAIGAFIIPYIFALNPAMLFVDTKWYQVVIIIITSIIGMFGISAALEGFIRRKLFFWERLLFAAGGLMLIIPETLTDVIGLAVILLGLAFQFFGAKLSKKHKV